MSMMVSVRYFARIREVLGKRSESFTLEEGSDLGSLLKMIENNYSLRLDDYPLYFSVNQEYSERGTVLKDGDEVALLYPPSGG